MRFNAEQEDARHAEWEEENGERMDSNPTIRKARKIITDFAEEGIPCILVFIEPESRETKYAHNIYKTEETHKDFQLTLAKIINGMSEFTKKFMCYLFTE